MSLPTDLTFNSYGHVEHTLRDHKTIIQTLTSGQRIVHGSSITKLTCPVVFEFKKYHKVTIRDINNEITMPLLEFERSTFIYRDESIIIQDMPIQFKHFRITYSLTIELMQ